METKPAFTVEFGEPGRKVKPPPARFAKNLKPKTLPTREELEQKQAEAEIRRKQQEEQMIQRVREVREECLKLDTNVQKLLQQDGKRHGLPGLENVKVMSKSEAKQTIKAVAEDFGKISSRLSTQSDGLSS